MSDIRWVEGSCTVLVVEKPGVQWERYMFLGIGWNYNEEFLSTAVVTRAAEASQVIAGN
jgi:hypothetical protein